MRAAVFHEVGKPLTIENVADPAPADDQIIISVSSAGICGSDLHVTQVPGITAPGVILGHEFAGVIVEAGRAVSSGLKPGARVTALPVLPCNKCAVCSAGLVTLCPNGRWIGNYVEAPGAYAQFVAVRAELVQRLPAGVSDEEGAMVEPLAVGHHIVERGEICPGAAVLIMGGGPIGAAVALFARIAGAKHVVVSEPASSRRERCMMLGATATIDPWKQDVATRFAAITGTTPQIVFECVGLPGMLREAVRLGGVRSRVIVAGVVFVDDALFPLDAISRETTIIYSSGYTEKNFAAVIGALARAEIDVAPLHTATVSLTQLPDMFESLRTSPRQCKVLIAPS